MEARKGSAALRHDKDAERKSIWAQAATVGAWAMQDRVDDLPIVRCPGCDQPMQPKERTPVAGRLVDIRYVCAGSGMETKRTIADEAR
jgi:hypothetical protein